MAKDNGNMDFEDQLFKAVDKPRKNKRRTKKILFDLINNKYSFTNLGGIIAEFDERESKI